MLRSPGAPRSSRPAPAAALLTWVDAEALTAVLVRGASFPVLKWLMTVLDPLSLRVLAAALLLGERVAWTSVAGGVAVVAGVMLTRRRG